VEREGGTEGEKEVKNPTPYTHTPYRMQGEKVIPRHGTVAKVLP
jgi:hypothetical protein